jgi:hypothetical protein
VLRTKKSPCPTWYGTASLTKLKIGKESNMENDLFAFSVMIA